MANIHEVEGGWTHNCPRLNQQISPHKIPLHPLQLPHDPSLRVMKLIRFGEAVQKLEESKISPSCTIVPLSAPLVNSAGYIIPVAKFLRISSQNVTSSDVSAQAASICARACKSRRIFSRVPIVVIS